MKTAIGTFNTKNLAKAGVCFYPYEKYTQEEYDKKKSWLASQINKMDCDIIAFQEVFHEEALRDVISASRMNGFDLFLAREQNGKNGPCVALVSRYKLINPEIIYSIPDEVTNGFKGLAEINKFSRPILKTKINLGPNGMITVLVAHLKSKRPEFVNGEDKFLHDYLGQSRALIRRSVEVAGLRKILLDELRSTSDPIVLLGDLNDSPRAVTSEIISGPNPYKFLKPEEKKKYWDLKMYSVYDILTQMTLANNWYTHIYDGKYEILDHIFLSEEFYFRNENSKWKVDYLKINNDHLADETNTSEDILNECSDHAQVVVHLESVPQRSGYNHS